MPYGTKDFSLFERQPRQGAAFAQTEKKDSYWNSGEHYEEKKTVTPASETHRTDAVDNERNFKFLEGGDLLNFSASQRFTSEATSTDKSKSWFGGTLFADGKAEHTKGTFGSEGTAKAGLSGVGLGGALTVGGPGLSARGRLGIQVGGYKLSIGGGVGAALSVGAKASLFNKTDNGFKLISLSAAGGLKLNFSLLTVERVN
jgi:hypothetical protein